MKTYIECDELYPWYYTCDIWSKHDEPYTVDVPYENIQKINAASAEFFKWQEYLEELKTAQDAKKYPDGVLKRTPEESAEMKAALLKSLESMGAPVF
jgi:hypothetical protein